MGSENTTAPPTAAPSGTRAGSGVEVDIAHRSAVRLALVQANGQRHGPQRVQPVVSRNLQQRSGVVHRQGFDLDVFGAGGLHERRDVAGHYGRERP